MAQIESAIGWKGKWVEAKLFFITTVGDGVHGAVSLQLKLKVFD